jgi:hypothetical protein
MLVGRKQEVFGSLRSGLKDVACYQMDELDFSNSEELGDEQDRTVGARETEKGSEGEGRIVLIGLACTLKRDQIGFVG